MGAIAVIRVRGQGAWQVVQSCIPTISSAPEPAAVRRLQRGVFQIGDEDLDDILVLSRRPDGTDVEISCHGGVRVVERIMAALVAAGAAEVEARRSTNTHDASAAVAHLADVCLARATTRQAALFLARQRDLLARRMAEILALADRVSVAAARCELAQLIAESAGAPRWTHPAEIALAGPPNAGKSLLASRLAGRGDIIVADRPGTTRDWVVLAGALEGLPVEWIDTAGVRPTDEDLERAAIAHGQRRIRHADLFLLVLDGSAPVERGLAADWRSPNDSILVLNKSDLGHRKGGSADYPPAREIVEVSALTGAGLERLRQVVAAALAAVPPGYHRGVAFTGILLDRLRETYQNTADAMPGPEWVARLSAVCVDAADSP
jgi:tRNA modification GTPase